MVSRQVRRTAQRPDACSSGNSQHVTVWWIAWYGDRGPGKTEHFRRNTKRPLGNPRVSEECCIFHINDRTSKAFFFCGKFNVGSNSLPMVCVLTNFYLFSCFVDVNFFRSLVIHTCKSFDPYPFEYIIHNIIDVMQEGTCVLNTAKKYNKL